MHNRSEVKKLTNKKKSMRKKIYATLTIVAVVAAGFATYRSYGSYGAKDNSLLMQNVEALAGGTESDTGEAAGGNYTSSCHILASGKCGTIAKRYNITYKVNGKDVVQEVYGDINKKVFKVGARIVFPLPSVEYKLDVLNEELVITGRYNVCSFSLLETCDRTKQKNCNGETDWNNNLAKPDDAID